jgi:hypothetical protein
MNEYLRALPYFFVVVFSSCVSTLISIGIMVTNKETSRVKADDNAYP